MWLSTGLVAGLWVGAGLNGGLAESRAQTPVKAAAQTAVQPPVRFAPERDYGPFVYAEADGRIRGLSVDLLALIAPRAGLTVHTLPAQDLSDILRGVQAGEVDLVSSLRPTPERGIYLGFTAPYVEIPAVLVMRRGEPGLRSLASLAGRRVGVGKAYAVEGYVRQKFPAVQWEGMANDVVALKALQQGQLDGVVADAASIDFIRREQRINNLEVHEAVGFQYALSFAYPRERSDLGEALAKGLRDLPRNERDAVVQRWMDLNALAYRPSGSAWSTQLMWGLAALAAVLALAVLWRRWRSAPLERDEGQA